MVKEVSMYKVFDGKRYSYEYSGRSKEGATSVARKWRRAGGKARVVPFGRFKGTKPLRARYWITYVRGSKER